MEVSKNAMEVLSRRYLRKDKTGTIVETPEQMMKRVATVAANRGGSNLKSHDELVPNWLVVAQEMPNALEYFEMLRDFRFLPNSPALANAGTRTGQLSACFVLPVEDDLASIFDTVRDAALIHQTGGGTGFAFSRLRAKGAIVASTLGVSSGPVAFMDVFNAATEVIKQGGMRRGANMGILRVDHPDILRFVAHKSDLTKLTSFNVSVAVTNAFMEAVELGTTYNLHDHNGAVVGTADARFIFKDIISRAWKSGEPGVVFIDRMNEYCPVPWMGQYEATNPCGEQPLIPYESCNLGSLNLEKYVVARELEEYEGGGHENVIDWPALGQDAKLATRFLDDLIDANVYPLEQLRTMALNTRKIGLGVMGFARMLFDLGVPYGSSEARELAGRIMSWIDWHSKAESIELARKRGRFPASIGHELASFEVYKKWFLKRDDDPLKHPGVSYASLLGPLASFGMRNSTTTTIAPTGTISLIAGTSGGCEPAFAIAFERNQADVIMQEADPTFEAMLAKEGLSQSERDKVFAGIRKHHGSVVAYVKSPDFAQLSAADQAIVDHLAAVFLTAHDITPSAHVMTQAAFQAFNDSATSKTINFPESATLEEVEEAYRLAWELDCKGITVYRDGSRQFQPLSAPAVQAAPETTLPASELKELRGDVCNDCGACLKCGEECDCKKEAL